MLPILKDDRVRADESMLIPLYKLVEKGFSPEIVAWATKTSSDPEALKRTLLRPEEFSKLKEYLKKFRG